MHYPRKNAGEVILISIKIELKAKGIARSEIRHLILVKDKIHDEDIIDRNPCLLVKHKPHEAVSLSQVGRTDRNTIAMADFNTVLVFNNENRR